MKNGWRGVFGRVLSAPFRFVGWCYNAPQTEIRGSIFEYPGYRRWEAGPGTHRLCCTTRTGDPHMGWCLAHLNGTPTWLDGHHPTDTTSLDREQVRDLGD
jgi:hypothetical protein